MDYKAERQQKEADFDKLQLELAELNNRQAAVEAEQFRLQGEFRLLEQLEVERAHETKGEPVLTQAIPAKAAK